MNSHFHKGIALTLGVGLALVAAIGCEEKKPEAPAPAPATTKTDATKTDAGKMVDPAKDAGKQAVDATKDAAKDAMSKATDAAKTAAASLSDDVKKTANDYMSSLGNLGNLLEKIKSPLDATTKLGEVKTDTGALSSAYAALEKLSPDIQASIKSTFKDQLDSLTKKVNDQIARISADKTLGSTLGEALKGVKLF
ncbi:MAG: hypothetical protein GC200_05680 [Tepidisphaera sp.]|nr:hypothetical protein [Tepidisphaera sp.]